MRFALLFLYSELPTTTPTLTLLSFGEYAFVAKQATSDVRCERKAQQVDAKQDFMLNLITKMD